MNDESYVLTIHTEEIKNNLSYWMSSDAERAV